MDEGENVGGLDVDQSEDQREGTRMGSSIGTVIAEASEEQVCVGRKAVED